MEVCSALDDDPIENLIDLWLRNPLPSELLGDGRVVIGDEEFVGQPLPLEVVNEVPEDKAVVLELVQGARLGVPVVEVHIKEELD